MGALCVIADVEALVGAPIPADATDRVTRLIELASGLVTDACQPLPAVVPDAVCTVTATMVARQYVNPTMATSEGLAGYRVGFASTGLVVTDADRAQLGSWAAPEAGTGAYSTVTPNPYATDSVGDDIGDGVWWPGYGVAW